MAASFPNAKKTFSQVVNGVTKLIASLYNSSYDEVEAIETFIGATGGGAQSYSESMKNLLLNYRRGCSVEYKSDSDLYVRTGEIMIPDASGNVRLRRNTSDLTVNWTNLDTGSEAAATTYYVYAVADASGTTFTVKISTNATTPTGCTFYKKIGSFYNDGSSNIDKTSFFNLNIPIPWNTLIYDYGTSASAYTQRELGNLKICFGTISVNAESSQAITNLPFSSASSYVVVFAFEESGGGNSNSFEFKRNSGSQFTIDCSDYGANGVYMWVAIGT